MKTNQKIDENMIINVISKRKEMEQRLKERQFVLLEMNQSLEEKVYTNILLSKKEPSEIRKQIEVEFKRQQETIEVELLHILEEQAVIRRICICVEALPFDLWDIINKLYIQGLKWELIKYSNKVISKRKKAAIEQIISLFESDYNDTDIINQRQSLGGILEEQIDDEE